MRKGLYNPGDFRDNCGFGLIAHIEGTASHELLATSIESLTCMTHRGGIAADGKTGDGCGLLMQKPDRFLRDEAARLFDQPLHHQYAVGQVFMSPDAGQCAQQKSIIEAAVVAQGLSVLGWRKVPTDRTVLGEIALQSLPHIEQVFVQPQNRMQPRHLRWRCLWRVASRSSRSVLTNTFSLIACPMPLSATRD